MLLLWDDEDFAGKPGTAVEMIFEDSPGEVLMLFEDDVNMIFEDT